MAQAAEYDLYYSSMESLEDGASGVKKDGVTLYFTRAVAADTSAAAEDENFVGRITAAEMRTRTHSLGRK